MTIDEFERHLATTRHTFESTKVGDESYLIIKGLPISGGSLAGKSCDVGLLRSTANPWVPQAAVHVRPHLVEMGKASSQASNLGAEWQYLSRRFDKVPTPKGYLAHIFTVLGEL